MKTNPSTSEWRVVIFLIGLLLFNYPVLALFSVDGLVFGIPVLYAYIFSAWGVLIALLAVVNRR